MSDDDNTEEEAEDISDFSNTTDLDPKSEIELTDEWVDWLAQADLPSGVEGVDASKNDLGDAESYA